MAKQQFWSKEIHLLFNWNKTENNSREKLRFFCTFSFLCQWNQLYFSKPGMQTSSWMWTDWFLYPLQLYIHFSPVTHWKTPEWRMSDCWKGAAAVYSEWLLLQQPAALPFTFDAEKVFFNPHIFSPPCEQKSRLYWPTRSSSRWGSGGVYVVTAKTPNDEIYSLIGWGGADGQRCCVWTGGEAVLTDS